MEDRRGVGQIIKQVVRRVLLELGTRDSTGGDGDGIRACRACATDVFDSIADDVDALAGELFPCRGTGALDGDRTELVAVVVVVAARGADGVGLQGAAGDAPAFS